MADQGIQEHLRAWSTTGEPEALCAAGLALLRGGRREELLDLLLSAWKTYPLPALGSWAQPLGVALAGRELSDLLASAKQRFPAESWTQAKALSKTSADGSVLIELLAKAPLAELDPRLKTLTRWGAEARLVRALTRWTRKPPYTSRGLNKAWKTANLYLAEFGDAHTVRAFADLQRHAYPHGTGGRGKGTATLKALRAAGRDAQVTRPEAMVPLHEALEAHLEAHLDAPRA